MEDDATVDGRCRLVTLDEWRCSVEDTPVPTHDSLSADNSELLSAPIPFWENPLKASNVEKVNFWYLLRFE